jgi:hypothetical protein
MKHIALVLALLMVATAANAALTKQLMETPLDDPMATASTTIITPVEDSHFRWNDWRTNTVPSDSPGESWTMVTGSDWGAMHIGIIAFNDMFNLPSNTIVTSADILSATLTLRQQGPNGMEEMGLHRITMPWLYEGAESVVTGLHRTPGGENPYWMADIGKTPGIDASGNPTYDDFVGFSTMDYTETNAVHFTITETAHSTQYDLDVTAMVRDMYDDPYGNQGMALVFEGPFPWPIDPETQSDWGPYWHPSQNIEGPKLSITYTPEPVTIGLLVVGGLALLRRRRR